MIDQYGPQDEIAIADENGVHKFPVYGEIQSSDWRTLTNFVERAYEAYKPQKVVLVISSHGDGWRAGGEGSQTPLIPKYTAVDTNGGQGATAMGTDYVTEALKHIDDDGVPLSVVGYDACLEGTIEVLTGSILYSPSVEAVVASELPEWGSGWPYDKINTKVLTLVESGNYTGMDIAKAIVDSYGEYWNGFKYDLTLGAFSRNAILSLREKFFNQPALGRPEDSDMWGYFAWRPQVLDIAKWSAKTGIQITDPNQRGLADIKSMLEVIKENFPNNPFGTWANDTLSLYNSLVQSGDIYVFSYSPDNSTSWGGLSIFFPTLEDANTYQENLLESPFMRYDMAANPDDPLGPAIYYDKTIQKPVYYHIPGNPFIMPPYYDNSTQTWIAPNLQGWGNLIDFYLSWAYDGLLPTQ